MENNSITDRFLTFIKMNDQVTAAHLATEFDMTKEGARQHLLKLENQGLVESFAKSQGVGRPLTCYSLTDKGLTRFPDSHAQITVELLKSVKGLLGDNALDLLISDREKQTYKRYEDALEGASTIEKRLDKLSQLRSDEGYMAQWKKEDSSYLLIENHCPICVAATECQGFCRAELKNFRQLMGDAYTVQRIKHIIEGGQRCVYKIEPKDKLAS